MDSRTNPQTLLAALALAGSLSLTSCVDDGYDLNEVDATIGIGSDRLVLPTSSLREIPLSEVLDLGDDDCIVVDSERDDDYIFRQTGSRVEPSHPEISTIDVRRRSVEPVALPLVVQGGRLDAGGVVELFDYAGDKPGEVVRLDTAYVTAGFALRFSFPERLRAVAPTIETMTIGLPSYMHLSAIRTSHAYTLGEGNTLTFRDVATAQVLEIDADIDKLVLTDGNVSNGQIDQSGEEVDMKGEVSVGLSSAVAAADGAYGELGSNFNMDDFTITGAYGLFDPDIDMTDLGSTDITGVPDFLDDDRACVDLANPQVEITIKSDLDITGYISGTLTAIKDGGVIAEVTVDELRASLTDGTRICICRDASMVTGAFDVIEEVADLSTLVERIPDRIEFTGEAWADPTVPCRFDLGRRYEVAPSYVIEAPLAFGENATIVYKDTIDDWNDDVADYELAEGAYIALTGTIENRVPAYLTMSVKAIDTDGNVMSDDDISVETGNTIIASADGDTPTDTPLSIRIRQNRKGAMARLDGIVLDIVTAASHEGHEAVVGQTLNAKRHTLIAKDVRIEIVGRIIADMN